MEGFEVALAAVLVSVIGLNVVASRIGIPYPIVLVVGGVALAVIPGMPHVELEPDLVLLVFLPPLVYFAAFFSEPRALRRYARALSLTSIGLVLLTTALVAVVGHLVLDLSWPMAFALGAIVSPTDPVAASAIMRRRPPPGSRSQARHRRERLPTKPTRRSAPTSWSSTSCCPPPTTGSRP